MQRQEQAEKDYMAGMKYREIAEKYGVSIETVKSWKKRHNWNRKKGAPKTEKGCTQNPASKTVQEECGTEAFFQEDDENGLTDKQRLFCTLYVRCFNATKAYQKAYNVSYETAAASGARLLRNVKVNEEIKRLKQNRINRELLDEDDIVQMYIDILYADITDYIDVSHNVINLSNPLVDGRLIKKVSFGKVDSVELLDKMKALQWLAEHMELMTERQKAEVEMIKSRMDKDSGEEAERRKQGIGNIADILSQIKPMEDGDVYE
ncbi:MAG: terminase small subunit [Alistipes sp.]|nr:terminase small subunit [Alistipes sp.]